MESLIVLAGLVFIGGPIVLFFLVIGARSRVGELERRVAELELDLRQLSKGAVSATSRSVAATAFDTDDQRRPTGELASQEYPQQPVPEIFAAAPERSQEPVAERQSTAAPLSAPIQLRSTSDVPLIFGKKAPANRSAEPTRSVADAIEPTGSEPATARANSLSIAPVSNDERDGAAQAFDMPSTPLWPARAKAWLFGGNLVAKVGLLILFIGVSFLMKYAAARVSLPIELRLSGIVLADIGLLLWGWRIRESRPTIALPVQGAALGILMLVTFGAFRMYELIPGGLAFGLLFFLTFFTCLLAVLQNAIWLAVFGIVGGFAAPIVTSTGAGSHIGLFSYYALLNAGILAIALKRSWRLLNLLGFAFTFMIGTAWGVLRYQSENYQSAQAFLLLFFVFYVALAILHARRQAPQLKHYVDGTLVFGTPLLSFGLQYGLVHDKPFGLAFSALAVGLFYIGLTLALWRRRGSSLTLLVESFLALGIVFGTLAIPFALDGRWTSAAWALEGAGIVWVGLRQKQKLAWMFGVLVQLGAWVSFAASVGGLSRAVAAQSNLWLGFLLLAGSGLVMATNFRRHGELSDDEADKRAASRLFPLLATCFLAAAALWLLAGAWAELFLREIAYLHILLVLSALGVAGLLGLIARRLDWAIARIFALVPQLLAGLVFLWLFGLFEFGDFWSPQFYGAAEYGGSLFDTGFLGGLLLAISAAFSGGVFHRQADGGYLRLSRMLLGWGAFWWFVVVLGSFNHWGVAQLARFEFAVDIAYPLVHPIYGLLLALGGVVFAQLARRLDWPDLRWVAYAAWPGLLHTTVQILIQLDSPAVFYIPSWPAWTALIALWLTSEWLLREGDQDGWLSPENQPRTLRVLHTLRTVGPWLILGLLVHNLVALGLRPTFGEQAALLADSGWFVAGSWARYLPAWAMMAYVALLIPRARAARWPTAPIAIWYRHVLIPLGSLCALALVVIWNFSQNGLMAPLPYLPILNPLDLSTGFAALLAVAAWRGRRGDAQDEAEEDLAGSEQSSRLLLLGAFAAYVWFNLMLLRTVAHFLDIPYQSEPLFRSQFVQAMLSLVWSATALVLMRFAAQRVKRVLWMIGAGLLVLVVAKLFFVDLSNVGGIERIISFLGVGVLMLAIGYLAPFPNETAGPANPDEALDINRAPE